MLIAAVVVALSVAGPAPLPTVRPDLQLVQMTERDRFLAEFGRGFGRSWSFRRASSTTRLSGGRARIGFTIESDGSITRLRLLQSSGQKELDEAGLNAVREATFRRPPNGQPFELVLPLDFKQVEHQMPCFPPSLCRRP